jgi:hypothetical protein
MKGLKCLKERKIGRMVCCYLNGINERKGKGG